MAFSRNGPAFHPETPLTPPAATPAIPNGLDGALIAMDLDGTLVDTAPDLIGTLNHILAERGHAPLPLASARHLVGHGARALLTRGFADAGEKLSADRMGRLFDEFIGLYRGRIALESRPYPGVPATLEALQAAGARLAVCTNKPTELSIDLLRALGLADRFAAIVGPDLASFAKPDPRHLLATIEAAGGRVEQALMVGDAATDRDAARAAAIPVVLVSYGYSDPPAADLAPDILVDSFAEIPAAARRLLAPAPTAISRNLPA